MNKHYVLSLSGGKDSTALLYLLIKHGYKLDAVVCNRMIFEEPEMYEHLDALDEWLFNRTGMRIEFITIEKDIEPFMAERIKRGKHKGSIRGFPLKFAGFCWISRDWKILPLERWRKKYEKDNDCKVHLYKGFAIDEKSHVRQRVIKSYLGDVVKHADEKLESFPLAELGYTEAMCLELIQDVGLSCRTHMDYNRSGCWFCQKASVDARVKAIKRFPERIEKIREWCELSGRDIYPDLTMEDLEKECRDV